MNHIRYIEHNAAHPGEFIFDLPNGHDCWLLLLTHTPALFWVDETWIPYPEESVVLYAPDTKILYRACGELFENDWLRFDSDEEYVASLPIQGVPFSVRNPKYYHSLFCQLKWTHAFAKEDHTEAVNLLIQKIFLSLQEDAKKSNKIEISLHFHALTDLRKAIYQDPKRKWRVGDMAEKLHLSEGYLQSLYHKTFGVSCMEDVISSRIRSAKSLLRYTNKTITQIAEFCGYNNTEHFCRQFKRISGQTPGSYRRWISMQKTDLSDNR